MIQTRPDARLQEALRSRSLGRMEDFRKLLSAVLTDDPGDAAANNLLGMDAMGVNDAERAVRHFEAALQREATALPLLINLAGAYRALGRDEDERRTLLGALDLDQQHLAASIRLAELHERRGELHEAMMRWSGVVALSAHVDQPTPALEERFRHARAFMAERTAEASRAIEGELADLLHDAGERDIRRARTAAEVMLGKRAVFVHRCEGMHYPFLPADEYFDRELFPWFKRLEAAASFIRDELAGLLMGDDAGLRPYVAMAPGTPPNKWSALDRKLDWSALHLWKEGEQVEEACRRAPRTAEFVETLPLCRIPGRAPTVFFSLLKAESHIPAHTGVTNTRAIVHLPLIVPEGCTFRVGGETRPWVEGEAFAFDDTIDHEAWNPTPHDRAVLILDVWNPHLSETEQAVITRLFAVADEIKAAG